MNPIKLSDQLIAFIEKNRRAIDLLDFGSLNIEFLHGGLTSAVLAQRLHFKASACPQLATPTVVEHKEN